MIIKKIVENGWWEDAYPSSYPPEFAPGRKLQKPPKECGIFQLLGTISNVFLFSKRPSEKGGGAWHNGPAGKNGFLVLRCHVFTENIGIAKNKKKIYTSSYVLFSSESIGEEKKKVFIVHDEASHFLRGPRFQPA